MSKDQYGQQYPQQPAYGQQYGAQTTHTTVVVRHEGCCSLRGRVQWVAGYNLVSASYKSLEPRNSGDLF